jgi:hypothetical protein
MGHQLTESIPGVSTAQHLRNIKEGKANAIPFDIKKTGYLRSKCSELKYEFPNREYKVNAIKRENITKVYWEAK